MSQRLLLHQALNIPVEYIFIFTQHKHRVDKIDMLWNLFQWACARTAMSWHCLGQLPEKRPILNFISSLLCLAVILILLKCCIFFQPWVLSAPWSSHGNQWSETHSFSILHGTHSYLSSSVLRMSEQKKKKSNIGHWTATTFPNVRKKLCN